MSTFNCLEHGTERNGAIVLNSFVCMCVSLCFFCSDMFIILRCLSVQNKTYTQRARDNDDNYISR